MIQDKEVARPVFTFTVPAKLATETGVKSVGLVQLTGGEELMATRRAGMEPMRLAAELSRESLREKNGTRLTDEDRDAFFADPNLVKIRTLVVTAYNQVNQPNQEDAQAFLQSCQVSA